MRVLFPVTIRVLTAAVLVYAAATDHEYSYYTFLRWFCFLSFWYFAGKGVMYKSALQKILFLLLLILFNPFIKFHFDRGTWIVIDYAVAAITTVSILFDFKNTKQ